MLQLDPPGQCHPEVHPRCLLSTQRLAGKNQKSSKTAKKGYFVRQNSLLRKCFLCLFPVHLVCLSERFVLDPKTLIGEYVLMEIWPKQNWPFSEFLTKHSILSPIKIWYKWSLKIAHTTGPTVKMHKTNFVCLSERFVLDPKTLIGEYVLMEIWPKQNWPFSEFLRKHSILSPIKIWSKWSLKIAQTKGPTVKMHKTNFGKSKGKSHANLMQLSCKPYANWMEITRKSHANLMPI